MKLKHLFLVTTLTAVACLTTNCKKEIEESITPQDSTPVQDTTPTVFNYGDLIIGKWNVVLDKSYESYTEDNDNYEERTLCSSWASQISLSFSENGILHYSATVGGVDDGWDDHYRVKDDTLTWDIRKYALKASDNTHLTMESTITEVRQTAGGTTYTSSATKHYELVKD